MKNIKLLLFTLGCVFLAGVSVLHARPHSPEDRVERLTEKLGLSDEQASTILGIMEDALASCEDEETRADHRACMKDQKEAVETAIKAELTEDQLETFESAASSGRRACRAFRRGRR